jgi:hypothetical protein
VNDEQAKSVSAAANEIRALETVVDLFEDMDAGTQRRCLEWLIARLCGLPGFELCPVLAMEYAAASVATFIYDAAVTS